ncbi:MAG: hypothetical protein Kow0092_08090 [Deferrisomatales bacterium]
MEVLLFVLAVLWVAFGALLILDTQAARDLWGALVSPESARPWGVAAAGVGLLLLLGALGEARHAGWLAVLGLLGLAKGVYLLRAPGHRVEALLEWWTRGASERTLRLWGIGILLLGAALLDHLASG